VQKACECINITEELIVKAAKEPDSLKRIGYVAGHFISQFNITKGRSKKPFNPMLGETFELVTEDFRYLSEQVSHHPPISAYYQEGKGYTISGFLDSKSKFGFGGGKGLMELTCLGW
jgi:oxysterol-binding protein 1